MRSGIVFLTVGETRLAAKALHGSREVWKGEMLYSGTDELAEAIARLVSAPATVRPGRRLVVALERPVVQLRVLTDLPAIRSQHLRSLVQLQSHRYFRRNGVPLVVDAMHPGGKAGSRTVHAAAVDEGLAAAIAEGARAGGFVLEGVHPVDPAWQRLSLVMPEERVRRRHRERTSLWRLGAAVGVLWACAVLLSLASHLRQRRAIDAEMTRIEVPLAALRTARREMVLTLQTLEALDQAGRERSRLLRSLGAIAAALPDSTFLASLTLDSLGQGRMSGYAIRASEVLARLDARGAVIAPHLEGQSSRDVVAGRERESFSIVFGPRSEPGRGEQ